MGKPPAEPKIVVNVKGVNPEAWERAKAAASKSGETLGQWISRAADQLAAREAGERIIPPPAPANPTATSSRPAGADLAGVAAVLQAMGAAKIDPQKRVGRLVNALLHAELAAIAPPAKPRIVTVEGQAAALPLSGSR